MRQSLDRAFSDGGEGASGYGGLIPSAFYELPLNNQ